MKPELQSKLLKGVMQGSIIGLIIGLIQADTRSFDYSSYGWRTRHVLSRSVLTSWAWAKTERSWFNQVSGEEGFETVLSMNHPTPWKPRLRVTPRLGHHAG